MWDKKTSGGQANEGALDVLLLNEAMGECIMTLKTFLSTTHLPTFPKQQRWKVEPLKLNYRFYSRRTYVVEEGMLTFTTLRFFYFKYRLLWTLVNICLEFFQGKSWGDFWIALHDGIDWLVTQLACNLKTLIK